jgi:hypothetical protein
VKSYRTHAQRGPLNRLLAASIRPHKESQSGVQASSARRLGARPTMSAPHETDPRPPAPLPRKRNPVSRRLRGLGIPSPAAEPRPTRMDYPSIPAAGRLAPWRRSGQDKVINQSSDPDSDPLAGTEGPITGNVVSREIGVTSWRLTVSASCRATLTYRKQVQPVSPLRTQSRAAGSLHRRRPGSRGLRHDAARPTGRTLSPRHDASAVTVAGIQTPRRAARSKGSLRKAPSFQRLG